jgi:hypothetical protein
MFMEYTISRTKRNLIIFSAVFLILKAFIVVSVFFAREHAVHDNTIGIILSILQIIPYGYIMIVITEYCNHYKLKALRMTTLILLLMEISGNMLQYFNQAEMFSQAEMNVPRFIAIGSGVVWTLIMIVWIILLVRISATDYPALISIRKYAISVIAVNLLSGTLPFLIGHITNIQQYLGIIVVVIGVLPNVFFIEFGLKLPGKFRTQQSM